MARCTLAGAWEIPPNVLVGILHTEIVPISWAFGLRNLIVPGNLPIMPVSGMPFDMSRNVICQHALNVGADAVLHLDSDVIPPRDAILRLLAHRQPIVSGLYCRRSPPWSVPVAQKDGQWLTNFKPGSTVEVDLVGAGCLLLRREFLLDMAQRFPLAPELGKVWFWWRSDLPEATTKREDRTSEDFSTCRAAINRGGYKVLLDTSIVCRHVGLSDSTYMHYRPAEVIPVT